MTTPFQQHVARWKDCKRCELWKTRKQVVFARGSVPADVLFVGEAPGSSENALGKPFIGPAGKLLDKIIDLALPKSISYCLTNLVCCIPLGEEGSKVAEPTEDSIQACWPRLKEFTRIVKPRLIVFVGKLAARHIAGASSFRLDDLPENPEWILKDRCLEFIEITHPAAILRMEPMQQKLAVRRAIVILHDAVKEISRG